MKKLILVLFVLLVVVVVVYLFSEKERKAEIGDKVTVHYTGWFEDGTVFDSSVERGNPFSFTLGRGEVIEGWEKEVLGMKIGEKKEITVPPEMGYGEAGAGPIPPGATLVFEIEVLGID